MPSTVELGYIGNVAGTVIVPTTEFSTRLIQSVNQVYTAGQWNPNNSYNWVPGAFFDLTPKRADSVITFFMRLPMGHGVGSTHKIQHFNFYANNIIYYTWEEDMTHYENGRDYQWQVPSWGTSTGRIGLQSRSHSDDGNELRLYTTEYWNGVGSNQTSFGQMIIEEWAII